MIINSSKETKIIETGETINSAGLVTITNNKAYIPFEYGDDYIFSNNTDTRPIVIDVDTNKALVFYTFSGSSTIKARLVTITDKIVTYGDETVLPSASGEISFNYSAVKISTNKVMIGYRNGSNYPTVMIVQVVDGSIVAGNPYTLKASAESSMYPKLALYAPNKVMAMYNDPNDAGNIYRNILTVTGDYTIDVGTATIIPELGTNYFNLTYLNKTGYLIASYNLGSDGGYAHKFRIIQVSGANVYVGSENSLTSKANLYSYVRVLPITSTSFVFVWADYGNSGYSLAKAYSYTNISNVIAGQTTILSTENDQGYSALVNVDTNKFIYYFNYGYDLVLFSTDGLVIKACDTKIDIKGSKSWESGSMCKISNGKCLVCYDDNSGSDYGYTKVLDINNSTGIALTPQFTRNNINVIPYISLF